MVQMSTMNALLPLCLIASAIHALNSHLWCIYLDETCFEKAEKFNGTLKHVSVSDIYILHAIIDSESLLALVNSFFSKTFW